MMSFAEIGERLVVLHGDDPLWWMHFDSEGEGARCTYCREWAENNEEGEPAIRHAKGCLIVPILEAL